MTDGQGWISTNDRLPENEDEVLVYVPSAKYNKVDLDNWRMQHERPLGFSSHTVPIGEMWDNHEFEEVSHWMPLPQAPLPDKEGK